MKIKTLITTPLLLYWSFFFTNISFAKMDSLPQREILFAAIDDYHNYKLAADLEEFNISSKNNWMNYMPTVGITYTLNGAPRPAASYSLNQIFNTKKEKEKQEAKKRSLKQTSTLQRQKDKITLIQSLDNYKHLKNDLKIKKQLFLIDEELFLFHEKRYKELEMTPSQFLLKKRDYISKKYEVSKLETEIKFVENEILTKAHYISF